VRVGLDKATIAAAVAEPVRLVVRFSWDDGPG